jgi:hypothetical protein
MLLQRVGLSLLTWVMCWGTCVQSQTAPNTSAAPQSSTASQTSNNGKAGAQIAPGVVIPAALSKSVDAKKAKPGDKVEAKTTMDLLSQGQVVIPRDTKVIGHVTEAKPHSKESPDSSLGLSFDRISMKDGREVPIRTSVQAIGKSLSGFAAESAGAPPMDTPSASAPDSRGNMGGAGNMGGSSRPSGQSGYPSNAPSQMPSAGTSSGSSNIGVLDPHSQGVVGMKGLQLSASPQASVVSSSSGNVHLDSGTQLVLRTE